MEKLTRRQLCDLYTALHIANDNPNTYKCNLIKEKELKELKTIIWTEIKNRK